MKSSILSSAGAMSLGVAASRVLGLVRMQVFAIFFGAGAAMDAFNIAFRIPNLLRELFGEGAMNSALVPTFVKAREKEGERRAWRVAGLVFRFLFVFLGILALAGIWFSDSLVELYASAFHREPGKFELTVRMTQKMFPFFPLIALAAAFMGILNACGRFFLPAFASAVFNATSVAAGLALSFVVPEWGMAPIEGMAIGVVLGGMMQALVQLPSLRRAGYRFPEKRSSDPPWYRDPYLKTMLIMMVPASFGMAATQINILVNSILATSEGSGAVSWLNYAYRLVHLPLGLFGVSMGAATLPQLSKLWVAGKKKEIERTIVESLKHLMAVSLPATAALILLGEPVIRLLFQYGSFGPTDSQATAVALAGYSVGLVFFAFAKVLVPACYAERKTRLAVVSSLLAVAATIALSLILVGPLSVFGLALATSLGALVQAGFLLNRLRIPALPILRSFALIAFVSAIMGWVCHLSYELANQAFPDSWAVPAIGRSSFIAMRLIKVLFIVVEGVFLVYIMAKLFKIKEIQEVMSGVRDLVLSRIKRRVSWPKSD